jgi:hypothetical protein
VKSRIQILIKVRRWILIRIKVIKIRNSDDNHSWDASNSRGTSEIAGMPATAVAKAGIPAKVVAKAGMPATIVAKAGMPTTIPVTAARQQLEMPATVGTVR